MRRVLFIFLVLGLSVSSAFAQATGQINGVVSDNSGGVVPGVTVFAVESGTGISRDTVTAANGRYSFRVIAAHDLRDSRRARRIPDGAPDRGRAAGEPEPDAQHHARARRVVRDGHRRRRNVDGRHHAVHAVRGRRLQAHRRAAAQRPRRRALEHARVGHGRHRGQPGIRQDHSRRAAPVDQWHRVAAGVVPSRRHEPHRLVLPAESAVPVPGRAAGVLDSDQQLQRRAGRQRRRGRQRRDALWNEQLQRRRLRLRARSHVQLEELLPARAGLPEAQTVRRLRGRPDHAQQGILLRRLAGHDDSERRRHAEQHGADGRDARR